MTVSERETRLTRPVVRNPSPSLNHRVAIDCGYMLTRLGSVLQTYSTVSIDNALGLEHTFATDLEGLYTPWKPEGFPNPSLLLLNRPLAAELGLDSSWLETHAATILSGSAIASDTHPLAQVYAGHQFGHFNPQLGDGRAVLLGEVVAPDGRRFDLQLKGSGATPYSRNGDGRAALDSILREYVISEAMHALGIPTTRSLAAVATGETVMRHRSAPGAVLSRVAASHLRVGTLEFFAVRRDTDKLSRLVNYALRRHYPARADGDNPAKELLDAVAIAQGKLIAQWMLVGFIHGVMNTDNMTLSGETIDYGPCAFMDRYDPKTVFSAIDQFGRYAYTNQPGIGGWNLARMAEALLGLISDDDERAVALAQDALELYRQSFASAWLSGMRAKLGLPAERDDDDDLAQSLLDWMAESDADYTRTFRRLSASLTQDDPAFDDPAFLSWNERWRARLESSDPADTAAAMDRVNPVYIPRNHKIEEALDAAVAGELAPTKTLLEVLSQPFTVQAERDDYADGAPEDFGPYRTHCNT